MREGNKGRKGRKRREWQGKDKNEEGERTDEKSGCSYRRGREEEEGRKGRNWIASSPCNFYVHHWQYSMFKPDV
jgi:hypothetical protein